MRGHYKFIDGSIFEFSDWWIHQNKYVHLISKSGEKIYVYKIYEWYRSLRFWNEIAKKLY